MLLIVCPHCGPRNSDEFAHNGEIRPRPGVNSTSPGEWRRYLYMRQNLAGWVTERWFHASGCRRFLIVQRHTVTNEIRSVEALS